MAYICDKMQWMSINTCHMKKFFTLALALGVGAAVCVNAENIYRLKSVKDDQYATKKLYFYDDNNVLIKYDTDVEPNFYHDYTYNEDGLLIRDELWLDRTGLGDYFRNIYYDYTYTEDGLLDTRTGYTSASFTNYEPLFSGMMKWVYDLEGKVVEVLTYAKPEISEASLTQTDEYYYNEKGLVSRIDYSHPAEIGSSTWEMANRDEYTYDEKDRLVEITHWAVSTNALSVFKHTFFVYDHRDDLIETYETGTNVNNKQSSHEYYYDDIPVSQVIYPYSIEENKILIGANANQFNRMAHRCLMSMDYSVADDGSLALLFEWEYDYDVIQGAGIEGVEAAPAFEASVADGVLTLAGVSADSSARIYDLEGRLLKSVSRVGAGVPVGSLAEGVYVVSTDAGSVKFVR